MLPERLFLQSEPDEPGHRHLVSSGRKKPGDSVHPGSSWNMPITAVIIQYMIHMVKTKHTNSDSDHSRAEDASMNLYENHWQRVNIKLQRVCGWSQSVGFTPPLTSITCTEGKTSIPASCLHVCVSVSLHFPQKALTMEDTPSHKTLFVYNCVSVCVCQRVWATHIVDYIIGRQHFKNVHHRRRALTEPQLRTSVVRSPTNQCCKLERWTQWGSMEGLTRAHTHTP